MLIEEQDEDLREIAREARKFLWRLLLLMVFFIGMMVVSVASAQAIYRVDDGNMSIVLYMDPCKLPEITNLKNRAVWTEKGVDTEGCWGVTQWQQVILYFKDRTATAVPQQFFVRVHSS